MAEAAAGSLFAFQKAPHEIIDCGGTEPRGLEYALTDTQTSPADVQLSEDEIISILNRTSGASAFYSAYGLRLPSGTAGTASADVMKIVSTGQSSWPYLAVYHRHDRGDYFKTELAASQDLKTWLALRTVSDASSMPDVRVLNDGSLLYAHERNPSGQRPYIDVMHFRSIEFFVAGFEPVNFFSIPSGKDASAEGTPSFGRIQYNGNILTSHIEITYHYFANGINDKNAGGSLVGFSKWQSNPSFDLNSRMQKIGYEQVGARERFQVGRTVYELVEGRPSNAANWSEWRVFLVNRCSGQITKLSPRLEGGAKSIGNPKISFLRLPSGDWAMALTLFVFLEGAAQTPPGTHLSILPLPFQGHAASANTLQ